MPCFSAAIPDTSVADCWPHSLLPLGVRGPPIRHIHHHYGIGALPKFLRFPLLDGRPPDVTELGRVAMVKFLRRVLCERVVFQASEIDPKKDERGFLQPRETTYRGVLPLEPARIAAVVRYRGPVQGVELLLLFPPEIVQQSHGGRDCRRKQQ